MKIFNGICKFVFKIKSYYFNKNINIIQLCKLSRSVAKKTYIVAKKVKLIEPNSKYHKTHQHSTQLFGS